MKYGEIERTKLPDGVDGIKFTVSRMIKMIQEGRKDPLVISTARKISALSTGDRKFSEVDRAEHQLRGIHAWCRANFSFVRDPVGIELIQTPNRMLRELEIPPQLHKAIWRQMGNVSVISKMPKPKMTGDADEATVISLSLAAAIGIDPLRIRLGGTDGTIHTCWGAAHTGGKWRDLNILEEKFGSRGPVKMLGEIDVPI